MLLLVALTVACTPVDKRPGAKAKPATGATQPDAASYRPDVPGDAPLAALLAWVPKGQKATVYDRACHPIHVERRGRQLYGHLGPTTTTSGNTRTVHTGEVILGTRIEETAGGDVFYRRAPDGGWAKNGTSAMGEGYQVGLRLSKVTADAAWYDGLPVRLRVACAHVVSETQQCTSGTKRTCDRCLSWGLAPSSTELHYGMGMNVERTRREAKGEVDCTTPCEKPAPPAGLAATSAAIAGHDFVTDGPEADPFVFRTEAACRAWRKAHPSMGGGFDRD